MKRIIKTILAVISVSCFLLIMLTGCGCKHEWKSATCTTPIICALCGETRGEALGHEWIDATCTEPRTCDRCGETRGEALGHEWTEATCIEPRTCSRCGKKEGEALGHNWLDATCIKPKTCDRCGAVDGKELGHDTPHISCTQEDTCIRCGEVIPALGHDWKDATCTEPKTCNRCGETEGEALGHEAGKAKKLNFHPATCTKDGYYDEVVECIRCHTELSRETVIEKALGHTTTSGKCSRCGAEIFEPIKGKGDDVAADVIIGNGLYRAHVTHDGRRYFSIWMYDADDDKDLLVSEVGRYDGYVLIKGKSPLAFEIEADGNWIIDIEKIVNTSEKTFSGKGDYVTGMASIQSGTYQITHDGEHYFSVWIYTTSGRDLLVSEVGKYDGKKIVRIPEGSYALFEITADGNWTINKVG